MIWLGWVLWHINHCRLFYTKYALCIYIRSFIFILIKYISSKYILWITFLTEPRNFTRSLIVLLALIDVENNYVIISIISSYFLNALFDQQSQFLKWFLSLNPLHTQKNKGHPQKAGGYSGRNDMLQLMIIKMRSTVWKIAQNMFHIKPHLKNSDGS